VAGEGTFAGEPFAGGQFVGMVTLGRDEIRKISLPLPSGAVFTKLDAKLSRLAHRRATP
jgi:hypothetical protein